MADRFAALEARTASAVHRHLFNASASGVDGQGAAFAFDVAFDDASAALLGMEATAPQALALSHQVQSLGHQSALLITRAGASQAYVIAGTEPDGTGLTRLILERAP
jgi:hypothetical protein